MIKIEKGGFYLNVNGEIVKISKRSDGFFEDENGYTYNENGLFLGCSTSNYDLIAYIPKELHYNILKTINEYHKNESYKSFVDKEFKKRTK